MSLMKWTEGDFSAVSFVRFDRRSNSGSVGGNDVKQIASKYLNEALPQARIRRVLGGEDDACFLVQVGLDADVRQSLNEFVLTIDAMPYLLSSKTELGRVVFADPSGDDDGLLNFCLMDGPLSVGLEMLREGGEKGVHVLDAVELLGPNPPHLITVRLDQASTYFELAAKLAGSQRDGVSVRAVYY